MARPSANGQEWRLDTTTCATRHSPRTPQSLCPKQDACHSHATLGHRARLCLHQLWREVNTAGIAHGQGRHEVVVGVVSPRDGKKQRGGRRLEEVRPLEEQQRRMHWVRCCLLVHIVCRAGKRCGCSR